MSQTDEGQQKRATAIRFIIAGVVLVVVYNVSRDYMHYQEKSATVQAKAPPPQQVNASNRGAVLTLKQRKNVCTVFALNSLYALTTVGAGGSLNTLYSNVGQNADTVFLMDTSIPKADKAYVEKIIRAGIDSYERMAPEKINQQLAMFQQAGEMRFLAALQTVCLRMTGGD